MTFTDVLNESFFHSHSGTYVKTSGCDLAPAHEMVAVHIGFFVPLTKEELKAVTWCTVSAIITAFCVGSITKRNTPSRPSVMGVGNGSKMMVRPRRRSKWTSRLSYLNVRFAFWWTDEAFVRRCIPRPAWLYNVITQWWKRSHAIKNWEEVYQTLSANECRFGRQQQLYKRLAVLKAMFLIEFSCPLFELT